MSTERKEQTTTRSSDAASEDNVRRPDQDIRRPRLRVKPVGSRDGSAPQQARKRNGTLFEGDADAPAPRQEQAAQGDAPPPEQPAAGSADDDAGAADEPKKVVVPPLEDRYPYATYRSAPADEDGEKVELEQVGGEAGGEREISAGFLLGIALVIVVLVGGIWLARLQSKVSSLETRLTRLEPANFAQQPE